MLFFQVFIRVQAEDDSIPALAADEEPEEKHTDDISDDEEQEEEDLIEETANDDEATGNDLSEKKQDEPDQASENNTGDLPPDPEEPEPEPDSDSDIEEIAEELHGIEVNGSTLAIFSIESGALSQKVQSVVLSEQYPAIADPADITDLTVTGNLNQEDLDFIWSGSSSPEQAFGALYNLTTLDLSGSSVPGNTFRAYQFAWSSIHDFRLPVSLQNTGLFSFYCCKNLNYINLSGCANLLMIGEGSFSGSGLAGIDLSGCIRLSSIEDYAFEGCSDLNVVCLPHTSDVISTGKQAFQNCRKTFISISEMLLPNYKNNSNWNYQIDSGWIKTALLVEITSGGHGSASANTANTQTGNIISLEAIPDSGYRFKKWLIHSAQMPQELNPADPNASFIMPEYDVYMEAVFEIIPVIDVLLPSEGFVWSTDDTPDDSGNYLISSGDYTMYNQSNIDLSVELVNYQVKEGTTDEIGNAGYADYIDLNLTGELAGLDNQNRTLGQNLLRTDSYQGFYAAPFKSGTAWNYSFSGYFQGDLPETPLTTRYILTLHFYPDEHPGT